MTLPQILALVIFLVMFGFIMWGKIHRYIPALIGGGLVIVIIFLLVMKDSQLAINTLNLSQLVTGTFWFPGHDAIEAKGINWQTIIFIAGMMLMVEGLAKVGFFRWMCLLVARLVKFKVVPILITFMLLSGFLSMFIDSITVMLFLASVTVELSRLLKFDPVPVIIAQIFASNTGGAATMSGDPPNIIIGTALGFGFMDFIENTGLIAWCGMVLAVVYFYFVARKVLSQSHKSADGGETVDNGVANLPQSYPSARKAITNPFLFSIHTAIFVIIILLLVTHVQTGLSVATIGVIAAVLTVATATQDGWNITKRLDWRTLLFFIGLFVCVSGLEETGVLNAMAKIIDHTSQGDLFIVITIILWLSVILSSIIDNIPFAATMIPVISSLSQSIGLPLAPLAWTLALGTDVGGNATPIGASANVVGTAIAEREGHPISWGRYCKYAFPGTIMVIGLIWIMLSIRYIF